MRAFLFATVLGLGLAVVSVPAPAQYPAKPIHLIVPFPAGGPSGNAARTLAEGLSSAVGQPIIVENRPGANGAIGAQAVLSAPPDGYTLLWGVASMVAIPLLQKTSPFESLADFAPVSMVGQLPFSLCVHPSVPAKSLAEFVTYARANPDRLSFATSTLSEFMAAAQLMKAAGISLVRVSYKGGPQAMPDLIAGRVQVNFGPVSLGLPYVRDGRLRMLAVLLPERSAVTPDVQTMAEAGMPGVSVPTWQAIFAPAKTPGEIIDRVSREVNLVLQRPEVRAQFERQTFLVIGSAPQALAATIKDDIQTWRRFTVENGIVPE